MDTKAKYTTLVKVYFDKPCETDESNKPCGTDQSDKACGTTCGSSTYKYIQLSCSGSSRGGRDRVNGELAWGWV